MANQAAWLTGAGARPFKVAEAPMPTPGPNEIVIHNHATAINPIEVGMQGGMMIDKFPTILGIDVAGEVEAVGSSVTRFKKGDRVIGMANGVHNIIIGGERKTANMAFQLYVCTSEKVVAKLPSNISFAHGCVLPLGLSTAACGLFQKDAMALPPPQEPRQPNRKVILIWGGSSSVGSGAIQLAHAAGFEVVTTASSRNRDYCSNLGASMVFDHGKESVVDDIVASLKGKEIAGAFSVIMDPTTVNKCAQVLSALGDVRFVQTVFAPGMPLPESMPAGFKFGLVFGSTLQDNEVGEDVWVKWITKALEAGTLQCKPDALVIGKGLDQLQAGMDKAAAGVSAQKVVVEL